MFVKLVSVGDLRTLGMPSLSTLHEFFGNLKTSKKVFDKLNTFDFIVQVGTTLTIPPGYIALLTSITQPECEQHEKSVAVVLQLNDLKRSLEVPAEDTLEIKANLLAAIAKNQDSETWSEMAPHLKSWLEEIAPMKSP